MAMPDRRYRIKATDTLRSLALTYGLLGKSPAENLSDLRDANKRWLRGSDDAPEPWNPGQQLTIPMGWSYIEGEFHEDDNNPLAGLS